jgi:hypothetical protein
MRLGHRTQKPCSWAALRRRYSRGSALISLQTSAQVPADEADEHVLACLIRHGCNCAPHPPGDLPQQNVR